MAFPLIKMIKRDCDVFFFVFELLIIQIAARAYDMASICSRRRDIKQHHLNFPLEQYTQVLPVLLSSSLPDFVAELKAELAHHRKRTQYHGVKMHSCGKWEAWLHFSPRRRAGAAASASPSSTMYIGIYETDRDAAMAVDQAQMLCFWKLYKEEGNSEESPKLNFPAEIYFPLCCTSSDPSTDNSIRITPLNDKQIERVLNVRDPEYDKN